MQKKQKVDIRTKDKKENNIHYFQKSSFVTHTLIKQMYLFLFKGVVPTMRGSKTTN